MKAIKKNKKLYVSKGEPTLRREHFQSERMEIRKLLTCMRRLKITRTLVPSHKPIVSVWCWVLWRNVDHVFAFIKLKHELQNVQLFYSIHFTNTSVVLFHIPFLTVVGFSEWEFASKSVSLLFDLFSFRLSMLWLSMLSENMSKNILSTPTTAIGSHSPKKTYWK